MSWVEGQITEGQCGYYAELISRNHCISDERHEFGRETITRLLNKGYRRYGVDYYRPYCRNCKACTPYRVLLAGFQPNRSMRRTLKRNANLAAVWAEPKPTQEKFELYVRYQISRHKDFGDASLLTIRKNLAVAMIRQMYMNPADSLELTVQDRDKVVAFAVFDRTEDALSAVYSVFEPDAPERSLGTFNILCAAEKARALKLPYLNLGLYLENHEKMAYKANFGPAEVYRKYSWTQFSR